MTKKHCTIVSCPYHACMSNDCQFSTMGYLKGYPRKCKKTFIPPAIKRKYNLHYRIRKQGFSLITPSRTIFLPPGKKISNQCAALRDLFGYSIQTQMF